MATFSSPEFGKADFVLLDQVSEPEFMSNLKLRFQKGKIYTYIGKGHTVTNRPREIMIIAIATILTLINNELA